MNRMRTRHMMQLRIIGEITIAKEEGHGQQ